MAAPHPTIDDDGPTPSPLQPGPYRGHWPASLLPYRPSCYCRVVPHPFAPHRPATSHPADTPLLREREGGFRWSRPKGGEEVRLGVRTRDSPKLETIKKIESANHLITNRRWWGSPSSVLSFDSLIYYTTSCDILSPLVHPKPVMTGREW